MLQWHPNPGPQEVFHSSSAFEVFYGGSAGGGKSESLLIEALRYVHVPEYTGILFRRTFPELRQARGLIERARFYYPLVGGKYNEQTHIWRFPSGASVHFGQMEHISDKYDYQSAEFAYVGFDELTTFEEAQYIYLFSRARTTATDPLTGLVIPTRVRSASNPGNIGHDWVKERFAVWIDKDHPNKASKYEIRYYKTVDEVSVPVAEGEKDALSRQFIPASLYDNPVLMNKDPQYETRLKSMSRIDRMRLLEGNWDALLEGKEFKPEWFRIIEYVPQGLTWVRYWDLAASVRTRADFTASAAIAVDSEANVYVRDMLELKQEWPDAKKVVRATMLGEEHVKKHGVEKKAHGLAAWQELMRDPELIGLRIEAIDVDTDKLSRARMWSPRAQAGKVLLVNGPWVKKFLSQAAQFDGTGSTHDDQIDTISGGIQMLVAKKWATMREFLHL